MSERSVSASGESTISFNWSSFGQAFSTDPFYATERLRVETPLLPTIKLLDAQTNILAQLSKPILLLQQAQCFANHFASGSVAP